MAAAQLQCNRYIKILQWYATVYMKTLTCTPHVHVHVRRTLYFKKFICTCTFAHVHVELNYTRITGGNTVASNKTL